MSIVAIHLLVGVLAGTVFGVQTLLALAIVVLVEAAVTVGHEDCFESPLLATDIVDVYFKGILGLTVAIRRMGSAQELSFGGAMCLRKMDCSRRLLVLTLEQVMGLPGWRW